MRHLVVDIETDGLWSPYPNKSYTKIHVIVTRDLDTDDVEVYTGDRLKRFKEDTRGATFIGHNLLGFDWWVLNDLLSYVITIDQCLDTLCMSRLDDSNRQGGHSLGAWGERLGIAKPEHDDWSELSDAMIHRCIEDTRINAKLYRLLKNSLREKNVPWGEVELECFTHWYMTKTERHGFYFDIQRAMEFRNELIDKRTDIESQLSSLFPPLPEAERDKHGPKIVTPTLGKSGSLIKRNLRNCPHEWFTDGGEFCWVNFPEVSFTRDDFVKKHLLKAGWKPKVFTPAGNPQLSDELMDDVISQVGEQYRPYQEWRTLNTRITKQLDKWLEFYNDDTRRQHGKIIHIGTRTHRMAHRDPPITQVPSGDSPYGPDCRQLWTVPVGNYLLGCDASGIQLRVLAHYTGDKEWIEKLTTPGSDIHQIHADEGTKLLGREVRRSQIKTITYSFLLGAGIPKLATQAQCSKEEAEEFRDLLYILIPGLSELMKDGKRQARRGYVISGISQRWIPCASDWHGDWLASFLQEGEATIMKRALKIWTRQATKKGVQYALVTQNHDEWQTELTSEEDARKLGPIQVLSLEQAGRYYNCKCPITGEFKIGKSWAETH